VATVTAARPRFRPPSLTPARRRLSRLLKPARPALANLAAMPLTAAGLACADWAAFCLPDARFWGRLTVAVSLVALEYLIADEDDKHPGRGR